MQIIKKNSAIRLFLFFLLVFPLCAGYAGGGKDTKQSRQSIKISYPQKIAPGDPLFIQLEFAQAPENLMNAQVFLVKDDSDRIYAKAFFYALPERKTAYLAILPLSTWLAEGTYLLQVDCFLQNEKISDIGELEVTEKNFIRETINLNTANTAIKTNTGPQRIQQIERLNLVLKHINYSSSAAPDAFVLPVSSERRTSFFGDRRIFAYSGGGSSTDLHYGIDFGVPTGTPVSSCAAGQVVLAEERISTGFSVVIEHLPGLYSLYYHLDSFSVAEGQKVSRGEQIGVSGSTGLATGPHLHWEVRLLGEAVNPDYFVYNLGE